jgi:hypothetical protein
MIENRQNREKQIEQIKLHFYVLLFFTQILTLYNIVSSLRTIADDSFSEQELVLILLIICSISPREKGSCSPSLSTSGISVLWSLANRRPSCITELFDLQKNTSSWTMMTQDHVLRYQCFVAENS